MIVNSQDLNDQKFDISFSYGLSYIDYANYSETSPLNFELPSVGTFIDFNFDFKLPKIGTLVLVFLDNITPKL